MQDRAKLLIAYNQELGGKCDILQSTHDIRKKRDNQSIKDKTDYINRNNEHIEEQIKKTKEFIKEKQTDLDNHDENLR